MKKLWFSFIVSLFCILMVFPSFASGSDPTPYIKSDGNSHSFSNKYRNFTVSGDDPVYYSYFAFSDGRKFCFFLKSTPFNIIGYYLNSPDDKDTYTSNTRVVGDTTVYFNYWDCEDDVHDFYQLSSNENELIIVDKFAEMVSSGTLPSVKSDVSYNSSIPAPQNLKFSYSNEGGVPIVHLGGTSYHKLSWSNEFVDPYSVRISVKVHILDTDGNEFDKEIMVASDGSDGADYGIAASSKLYKYNFGSLADKIISTGVVDKAHLQAWTAVQYRVQFYQYDSGVLNVGPVGVVHLKKNMFGVYSGTVVTTETPIDKDNIGSSGGLFPGDSSDSWTSAGRDYDEFDISGNIIGSGVVGDDSSYVNGTSHNAFTSITEFLNSLVNIPTVISQLFNSLSDMMSGLGELPSLIASLFSSMPAVILTMIGLGISLAVVLRIVGR